MIKQNHSKSQSLCIDLSFFIGLSLVTIVVLPLDTHPFFSTVFVIGSLFVFWRVRTRNELQSVDFPSNHVHRQENQQNDKIMTEQNDNHPKRDISMDHVKRPIIPASVTSTTADMIFSKDQESHINKLIRTRERTVKLVGNGNDMDENSDSTLPRGQKLVKKWPILDLGYHPEMDINVWEFEVILGDDLPVKKVLLKDLIQNIEMRNYTNDLHCVTTWSMLNMNMDGLSFQDMVNYLNPNPEWKYLIQYGLDGYSVNVHREDVMHPQSFLALKYNGQPITREHGYVRLMIPNLFGWKGCKFLCGLKFSQHNEMGFWEQRGSHFRGRVKQGERYHHVSGQYESSNEEDSKKTVQEILEKGGSNIMLRQLKLVEIPKELSMDSTFEFISELNLDSNLLEHVHGIKALKSLTRLNLNNNCIREFPIEICFLTNLTELFIMNNQLTTIPPEISSLKTLVALWFDNNQLETLPKEIGELHNLLSISLYRNKLKFLPSELSNLTSLRMLSVADNPDLQNIPDEYYQLKNVNYFGLERCRWGENDEIPENVIQEGAEAILQALEKRYLERHAHLISLNSNN
ncbi:hypothetical protein C9374_013824 [Naegleria lovaniensis]|uniref:Uncharacterized protein n=1 Tax=Naegleria lovaniensis TaxID=51637 RepID=A0AA88GDB5_NAELO|nr:uncharacterized protein C9374_013824 [Naegleria lovaniensis]KAG2370820.1 hypothetical protein C9374_013824 [Naegleria lovaniensis]